MHVAKIVFTMSALLLSAKSLHSQNPIKGLESSGPDPSWKAKLDTFGQFVGDWTFEVTLLRQDGSKEQGSGSWHFAWVLEGRAIQDVWIANYRPSRPGDQERGYGTTLRFYDPKIDAWRVTWISPLSDNIILFTARKAGGEIVMESKNAAGGIAHWIFSDITPSSFRWRSEGSRDGGKTWIVGQEFRVRRANSGTTTER